MDEPPDWSRLRNSDLSDINKTEFQGITPFELPAFPPEAIATAETTHPFKVTYVSGNVFNVQAGTVEGQLITTQTIDVGATRPVAILAYPQYVLNVWNSEYVWFSAVDTGANAPVLEASTTTLSDVTTAITGTQARALIAYIDGGVISQIATGNIVSTRQSDGTLTGQISLSFNKNS